MPHNLTIIPWSEVGPSRTGSLDGITQDEISAILGMKHGNAGRDGDGKVTREWNFKVKGYPDHFSIWDYKNRSRQLTSWSTYGNPDTLEKIFGDKFSRG